MNPNGLRGRKARREREYVSVSCLFFSVSLLCPFDVHPQEQKTGSPGTVALVLRIQICDATGLDAETFRDVEREVDSIYAAVGPEIRWIENCEGQPIEDIRHAAARVYILGQIPRGFLCRCLHFNRTNRVMGFTPTDPGGKPGSVVYVSRDSVQAIASDYHSKPITELHLSRALGRVVAHELAHRFLGQKEHTRRGILRGGFNRRELIGPKRGHLVFDGVQSATILRWARAKDSLAVASASSAAH